MEGPIVVVMKVDLMKVPLMEAGFWAFNELKKAVAFSGSLSAPKETLAETDVDDRLFVDAVFNFASLSFLDSFFDIGGDGASFRVGH